MYILFTYIQTCILYMHAHKLHTFHMHIELHELVHFYGDVRSKTRTGHPTRRARAETMQLSKSQRAWLEAAKKTAPNKKFS